ncbi:hypothetical protein [Sphingopyxis sp.]|uniref:hypothetical protein n=1 Tax=Sphingopyxis sp. TaxID=1908224 RepID=UPI003D6CBD3C
MMRVLSPLLFVLMLVGAFSLGAAEPRYVSTKLTDDERAACFADGGTIKIMGLSGNEGCARPMPDAGKSCTDASQCKAGCFLDTTKPGFKFPEPRQRVYGACAATDYGFGCRTNVTKGRVNHSLCVD